MNTIISAILIVVITAATLLYCYAERRKMQKALFEAGRQNVRELLRRGFTAIYAYEYALKQRISQSGCEFHEGMIHELETYHGMSHNYD